MTRLTPDLLIHIAEYLTGSEQTLVVGSVTLPRDRSGLTAPVAFGDVLELDIPKRFDLGLVIDPSPRHAAEISRIRDIACRRVLLLTDDEGWSNNDLLALGFQPVESPDVSCRVFLHDSDLLNQPRDWNNSSNWANPENFDKYRW